MLYGEWGSLTSLITAPPARRRSTHRSIALRMSGERPSPNASTGSPILFPRTSFFNAASYAGTATSAEVESRSSWPAITWRTRAASRTELANGPIWSNDEESATSPYLETRPYVGFNPTTPQNAAGWRMEPPVSVPRAA